MDASRAHSPDNARSLSPDDPAGLRWYGSRRMIAEWWGVLMLATAAVLLVGWLAPPTRADNLLYDVVLRLSAARPNERILIVAIDNQSIAAYGRWPWSRDIHARLIDRLTAAGSSAVGYDVLFPEAGSPTEDVILADAIAGNRRLVLPLILEVPGLDGSASRIIPPIAPLARAARGLGHVVTRTDRDGLVRGFEMLENGSGQRLLHLAEVLKALIRGDDRLLLAPRPSSGDAIYVRSRLLIPFSGPAGTYPTLSFVDVAEGRVPADILANRIVLVGATANGMGDRFATPMSQTMETMPGVELNANYLDSLLDGRIIHPVPPWLWLLYSLLPVWLLMVSLWFLGPRVNLWAGIALGLLWFAITLVSLTFFRVWLPPALALMAIALIFPLWGWRRLDLANRYMLAEMQSLRQEEGLLPGPARDLSGDPVERQIILMHAAIRDVRNLREFVGQSLDNLPDAALVTDLDGKVMIANDAADALFMNRVAGNVLGRSMVEILASFDSDPRLPDPRAQQVLQAMAAQGEPEGYETRLDDGLSLEIQVAMFRDSDRRPMGWIARFADITPLRASERQREDALRLLTHDMRSPQASILALLESDGGNISPDLARRIARYAHQTLDLANDFVYLARAESGRYMIETFNLGDALLDAVDDMWPLAHARAISITPTVPESEVLITGDRALITRAITNILSNAIKYSGEKTAIAARLTVGTGQALVEIEDHGRGIEASDLSALFEPFSRLAAPEGAPAGTAAAGAGLGLAFVKAVIERHRGRVWATSEPGVGSTFSLRLPCTEDALSPSPAAPPAT